MSLSATLRKLADELDEKPDLRKSTKYRRVCDPYEDTHSIEVIVIVGQEAGHEHDPCHNRA